MTLSEFVRQHAETFFTDLPRRPGPPRQDDTDRPCRERWGYLYEILIASAEQADADGGPARSDSRPVSSEIEEWAARHVDTRQQHGYPLEQVVQELQALKWRVLHACVEAPSIDASTRTRLAMRFGAAMDRGVATAVGCYDARLREAAEQQAELHARLARSEQRLRALLNASSHVVYRMSADGSEMRELDGRGTVSDTVRPNTGWMDEYVLPQDQPAVVQAFREALRDKRPYEVEHRYRRMNGKIGWTLSRAVPLFDEEGRIVEWFGAATDITARRQVEETLREADRRKEEFLAVLGHELRNPLAPLRTCVDLLDEARRRPDLITTLRPMMERQLSHLVRLVDDLLDVSRISRGQLELQRVPLDLNQPVAAAVEQTRHSISENRHDLEVRLAEMPLTVFGDAVRLTQVVANLLNNAAKYMDRGGRIRLTTASEGGQAVVRVRDEGYGIPPEHVDKLFKLFNRIDGHHPHSSEGGLGVGLALSHQLVALHGGTIEARSEGPGRGSEFIVRLALLNEQETTREQSS
ncbi:MAG TPA: ATP-binding protein [Pseudomonadales bacterium]